MNTFIIGGDRDKLALALPTPGATMQYIDDVAWRVYAVRIGSVAVQAYVFGSPVVMLEWQEWQQPLIA